MPRPLPKWAVSVEAADGEPWKACCKCGRRLTLTSFHRYHAGQGGLKDECKECIGRYQVENWDKMRAAKDKYEAKTMRQSTLRTGGKKQKRSRLDKFLSTGEYEHKSEQDAKKRLAAFAGGASGVYDEESE